MADVLRICYYVFMSIVTLIIVSSLVWVPWLIYAIIKSSRQHPMTHKEKKAFGLEIGEALLQLIKNILRRPWLW